MNELTPAAMRGVELASLLTAGMLLDRAATKRLLRQLTALQSDVPGCAVMIAQLRGVLARTDWVRISIVADPRTIRTAGVNIGIAEAQPAKLKTGLTPMQKWQRRNGLRR
jgi:hypothetical protein